MDTNILDLNQEDFLAELRRFQREDTYVESSITDEEFDYYVEFYNNKFNTKFNDIGSTPEHNKVKLPQPMASQDKIKGEFASKEIEKWKNKNDCQNIVIEEKIDGVALSYVCNSEGQFLYTRGDGDYGEDKSYLLDYLNFPIPDEHVIIRGELAIENDVFNQYVLDQKEKGNKNKLKKPRNIVTGIVNSKTLDIDIIKKLKFYAFEILFLNDENYMKPSKQLSTLKKYKFNTTWYEKINNNDLTVEYLEELLKRRKNISSDIDLNKSADEIYENNNDDSIINTLSNVDIDGLVVIADCEYDIPNENKNPEYSFAFKLDTTKVAIVEDIVWKIHSKDGYITPVIIIEPINLLGSDLRRVMGHTAKNIIDNKIGKGAKILITLGGDIIPTLLKVIKKAKSKNMIYPDLPEDSYEFNSSGVKFVLINPEDDPNVRKTRIEHFMKAIKLTDAGLGPARIDKLFEAGFDSLDKIFTMKPDDIWNLDDFGKTSAINICLNIKKAITNVPLVLVMVGTCIFGEGMAEGRLTDIIDNLDLNSYEKLREFNKLEEEDKVNRLQSIHGIKKKAYQFIDNLPIFLKWFKKNKDIIKLKGEVEKKTGKYSGKVIVLSDVNGKKELGEKLENMGGKIEPNVTKKTNILIVGANKETNKVKTALKYKAQGQDIVIINIADLKL